MKCWSKKIVCIFLMIVMVISVLPSGFVYGSGEAAAEEWEYETYNETIKITGYKGNEEKIVVPSEIAGKMVTAIGDGLFFDNTITSVTIPESVRVMSTTWMNSAGIFSHCYKLESIHVDSENQVYCSQEGVLYSKDKTVLWAYPKGKSGSRFIIPDGVEYLAKEAFLNCTQLTNLTVPNSVVSIGDWAFNGCTGLTDINIPSSIKTIGHRAFGSCQGLSNVTIPNGVTSIGDGAFADCVGIETITIPKSVILLGKGTFTGCINLKKAIFMGKKPSYFAEDPRDKNTVLNDTIFNNTHKDFILYYPKWYEKNWSDYTYYPKQPHYQGGLVVESIVINREKITVGKSKIFSLKETVTPANATNKNVIWSTSDSKVATVSQSGIVMTKSGGKCTITVATEDGDKKASCQVTVRVPVTKLKLNRKKLVIKKGKKYKLKAKILPKDATVKKVFWRSSNKKVATVSKKGVIKARKKGKCKITVITRDGRKKASCKVTVRTPVTKVRLNRKKLVIKKRKKYKLEAKILPKDATVKKVFWRSSNKKVATVSKKGVIKGRKKGKCEIIVLAV